MRSSLCNFVLAMLLSGPLVGFAQVATNIPERIVEVLEEIRDGNEEFVHNLQDYLTYSGDPASEYLLDNLYEGLSVFFGSEMDLYSLLSEMLLNSSYSRNYLKTGADFWSYLNTNRLAELETDIITMRNNSTDIRFDTSHLTSLLSPLTFSYGDYGGALLVDDISRGEDIGDAVEVLRGLLEGLGQNQIALQRAIARITDQDIPAPTGENASSETYSLYQSIDLSAENTNDLQNAESEVEFNRGNVELEEPSLTGEMFPVRYATEFEPVQSSSVISLIPRNVFDSIASDTIKDTVQSSSLEVSITSNPQLSDWIDRITTRMQDVWFWVGDIACILIGIAVYRPFLRDMLQPQGRLPI